MNIAEAGSTMYPCLFEIKRRGYTIHSHAEGGLTAVKGEDRIHAYSAEALLGLIVMGDSRGPTWNIWTEQEKVDYKSMFVFEE